MHRAAALLLPLLAACGQSIVLPGVDTVVICEMESGCPEWEGDAVVVELDRFAREWDRRFGDEPAPPATITVRDHVFAGIDWRGQDGHRVVGYNSGEDVVVVGRDLDTAVDTAPADTSLFHEMVHMVLRSTTGSPGGDHGDHADSVWTDEHDAALSVLARGADAPVLPGD